ncbi:MAG TPA: TIGR00266 family protein [Alphaproteobacteria bacterium]|nr:TIGR00266 family protein [Rhodospirillaceae bacterium]HRJ12178.1 TIGR00266 family protein [Alphaproteobacteria bacterium]
MFQHDITYHQAFPVLKLQLPRGGAVKANGNAMVAMSDGIKLTGKMEGGVFGALWRSFSGESFFLQRYEAEKDAWLWLGPAMPGAVVHLPVHNQEYLVTRGGFLAGSTGIEVSTKLQNLAKGLFSGEGLFVVRISGSGDVFLSTFGGVETITLQDGEECVVDFGRLVAWPASMKYNVMIPAKGLWSAVITGEILACRFTGPGTIYVQTLSNTHFGVAAAAMIQPFFAQPNKT